MQSWHIHISGLVQGVGFRPHVYRLAHEMNIKGTVCNTTNGVHIYASAEESVGVWLGAAREGALVVEIGFVVW